MPTIAFILCIIVIALTAIMLYKGLNPQGVLIFAGLIMISLASVMGVSPITVLSSSGSKVFDIVQIINETFVSNIANVGLMIMSIGGYVAFMNKIKATDALVYIAIKPLGFFKKYPYLASVIVIPIGQVLFMTIPSAAGLGLLLVVSFYPILTNLGVSKMTALSVISAASLFDQGPSSANTNLASELIGISNMNYFVNHQIPLVVPTTIVLMVLYYFSSRYFDKKDKKAGKEIYSESIDQKGKPDVPMIFAILPLMPLLLLIIFSDITAFFDINLSTTGAMLFSFIVSVIAIMLYTKSIKRVMDMLDSFWKGMGSTFSSVVTLIVSAEVFSRGLISLGFIETLVNGSTHLGFSGVTISLFMTILIFFAAMLMGSGNAAFFSFGPLVPDIAVKLGMKSYSMILPMQLSASMGRAASPIAGVIVAIAGVVGVSPMDLAKRNLPPLLGGITFLLLYHFLILS